MREINGHSDGGGVYSEEQNGPGLQLLPQFGDGYRRCGVIDDGYIGEGHAAGLEDLSEEGQLVVRQEGGAGGVDEEGDVAAVVAERFIGRGGGFRAPGEGLRGLGGLWGGLWGFPDGWCGGRCRWNFPGRGFGD